MSDKTTMRLEILSPEGEVYAGAADQITLPTTEGELTILPMHAPLFATVAEGEIVIKTGADTEYVAVAGGFLEVFENKVNILAHYAVHSEDIEVQKAEEARRRAETLIREQRGKRDQTIAEKELKRSLMELKVADRYRKRRKA